MLEVVGLSKVYRGKKGTSVRALDNVSLQFPETGMVFLLGKSGSGKSTLLNVCGGLDSPTEGEIIVKGRSSKSFSQSDFDSYRNTFIGFIFQEYNILNEFSVEDNIALALELQGKPKRRKDIAALLEEVDLKGFARRKPNTLSGGQKQRIAIARALVKNPEIIMADEPTGALDSNTGRQVLETLKKLSRDKLVIVVSHDRDFAEKYGDRIIELADGKVISDITKTQVQGNKISENMDEVEDILSLKKGSELTDEDFEKIKSFLRSSEGDVIIAKNEKDVRAFKKSSGINDDGEREVFRNTDVESYVKKEYSKADGKFIRSKLPLRHAFKIGVSGMGRKPIRLTFTVLLCTVAFVLFGVVSTMSFYDTEQTFKETLPTNGTTMMSLNKFYNVTEYMYNDGEVINEYSYNNTTAFTPSDVERLKASLGNDIFGGVRTYSGLNVNTESVYWQPNIASVAYLPEGNSLRNNIVGIDGTAVYPAADDEMVVSSYIADMFLNCTAYDTDGKQIEINSRDELIGKRLTVGGYQYTIVGIMNVPEVPARFEALKSSGDGDNSLRDEFYNVINDGLYLVGYVSESHLQSLYKNNGSSLFDNGYYNNSIISSDKSDLSAGDVKYWNVNILSGSDIFYFNSGNTSVEAGEVVVAERFYYDILCYIIEGERKQMYSATEEELAPYNRAYDLSIQLIEGGVHEYDIVNSVDNFKVFSEEERISKRNELNKLMNELAIPQTLNLVLSNQSGDPMSGKEMLKLTIVGTFGGGGSRSIFLSEKQYNEYWTYQRDNIPYCSEVKSDYVEPDDARYSTLFVPYSGDKTATDALWTYYGNETVGEDGTGIALAGTFVYTLQSVDSIVKLFSNIFLWVGIALAAFAALLFSNFISVSISYKKREIGILRAVGARSLDVFKIFFSESMVISLICLVLSTVGSVALCAWMNESISAGLGVSLFVFGPLSFLVLTVISAFTAFIATFLPVYRAAKKKPVDSIRSI